MDGVKKCSGCGCLLPIEEFHRDGHGYPMSRCRHCRNMERRSQPRPPTIWTPALAARLHELAAEGMGPAEIAREMQVSKNTISGRMWREGLLVKECVIVTMKDRLDALHAKMDAALGK
jgi:hypothetical protein